MQLDNLTSPTKNTKIKIYVVDIKSALRDGYNAERKREKNFQS